MFFQIFNYIYYIEISLKYIEQIKKPDKICPGLIL